ncbi:MAG: hypothetical protein ACJ74U_14695 [Jatrophihabitantaceae bacterium]
MSSDFRQLGGPGWAQARVLAVLATLAGFAFIALTEVAAIIAQVPVEGRAYSPRTFAGVLHPNSAGAAFAEWAKVPCPPVGADVAHWLRVYCAFDVVFTIGYGLLLCAANKRWCLRIAAPTALLVVANLADDRCLLIAARWLPRANGGNGCTDATFGPDAGLFWVMTGLTIVKWLAAAALLTVIVYQIFLSDAGKARAGQRRAELHAVSLQKYLLIVVGALSALLLVHGSALLEQAVDVERSWFDGSRGLQSAGLAVAGFVLLALVLRYLSSVHVGGIGRTGGHAEPPPLTWRGSGRTYLPWLIGAAGFGLSALVMAWTGRAQLDGRALWVTVAVTIAVPALSLLLRWVNGPSLATHSETDIKVRAWKLGRLLAYAPLVVLLLSVTRAYVPPMVLNYGSAFGNWALIAGSGVLAVLLVYAVLSFGRCPSFVEDDLTVDSRRRLWHPQVVGSPSEGTANPAAAEGRRQPKSARAVVVAFVAPALGVLASFVVLVLYERQSADIVGVIGICGLCFCGLSAFYALLVVAANVAADPPYVFRLMRMRRTPVVGLVLVIALVSTTFAKGSPLHDVRGGVAGTVIEVSRSADGAVTVSSVGDTPVGSRVLLPDAFTSWERAWDTADSGIASVSDAEARQAADRAAAAGGTATDALAANGATDCGSIVRTVNGVSARIRPMLFIAAEGGGIRAEAWTINAMSRLLAAGHGCGKQSIFVVSGVSGSATGLSVLDTSPKPMRALADSTGEAALANGVSGLLAHDLISGVFGVNVRPVNGQPGEPAGSWDGARGRFPDRAALMEQAWERDADGSAARAGKGLGQPFPIVSAAAPSWRSIFNGTSVGYGCRALVSDIDFGPSATSCAEPANPMPGSYDLLGAQPCYLGLPVSTAALLAARFPYVTPSGVIRRCETSAKGVSSRSSAFSDQLIDGGYSENTGLDSLNNLLGQLMPQIRAANAASAESHPQSKITAAGDVSKAPLATLPVVVVPLVVFLHNTTAGSLPDLKSTKATAELSLPVSSGVSGKGILGANATLLQRASVLTGRVLPAAVNTGGTQPGDLAGLESLVASTFSSRTMTVGPQFAPQIALPLGWVLSQETAASMRDALDSYLRCVPSTTGPAETDPCAQTVGFNALATFLGVPRCWDGADANGDVKQCDTKQQ